MSRTAWIYILGVIFLGALVMGVSALTPGLTPVEWLTFLVLATLATVAQFLGVEAPGRQHYYPHLVFFFTALLLLHPLLFALVVIIPHLVEWAQKRLAHSPYLRNWYLQPFNISNHLVAGFLARAVWSFLRPEAAAPSPVLTVVAVITAALVYAIADHAIIGQALVVARRMSWRESGVLEPENVLTDLLLLLVGYMVAELWGVSPWLIVPALSPLALIYRALTVPQLKQEAQTDAKTGLLNARHWNRLLTEYLERASRLEQPLAVIMADLDLLRNINNTYGHLAGDAALIGVSEIIRTNIRERDFAGRFGGEEFAIALPDTEMEEALVVANRIREVVAAAQFRANAAAVPFQVTLSLGVACFPRHGAEAERLIHEADVALYQAKLAGRNRVGSASEVPHSMKLKQPAAQDEQAIAAPVMTVAGEAPGGVGAPPLRAAQAAPPAEQPPAPAEKQAAAAPPAERPLLMVLVTAVCVAGLSVASTGFALTPPRDWLAIGLLAAFAVLAELYPIMVYRHVTTSVSVAVNFAAALAIGLPGVVCTSAAIILTHYFRRRPKFYRSVFNWATHVLAGAIPVFVMHVLGIPLILRTLPILAVPVVLSAFGYYLMDTGLVAAAISMQTAEPLVRTWRQQFRWLALYYLVLCLMGLVLAVAYLTLGPLGIAVFALPVFMMRYAQQQYVERTEEAVNEVQRMNSELAEANQEIIAASKAIRQLNDELFLILAKIIDARDKYVFGHSVKVAEYATAIADEMRLSAERLAGLRQAALLHDLGKICVAEGILNKPSSLTSSEYQRIQAHSVLGAEFLETSQNLRTLAPFVRHHHEWWDGSGYPDALRGDEIPLEARILAVSDAVEAMASDRPYHRGMSLDEIVSEIQRHSGVQFDPAVAEAFTRVAIHRGSSLVTDSARAVLQQIGAQPPDLYHTAGVQLTPQFAGGN